MKSSEAGGQRGTGSEGMHRRRLQKERRLDCGPWNKQGFSKFNGDLFKIHVQTSKPGLGTKTVHF